MARQPLTESQKRYRRIGVVVSLVAAVPTLLIIFALKPLIPAGPVRLNDVLALNAGFILMHMTLATALMHLAFPKLAGLQRHRFVQVLSPAMTCCMLLLPIMGARFIDPTLNFAIVVVLTASSFLATWVIWRAADELMRDLMKDAWTTCFLVLIFALWIYAAGERTGMLSGITAWGAIGIASFVSVICSYWTLYRRGLDRPPSDD